MFLIILFAIWPKKAFDIKEDKRLSNKEDIPYIKEYCLNPQQRLRSKQLIKWDYEKKILQEDLLFKYEKSKLFFANAEVKRVMEEFISTGKII